MSEKHFKHSPHSAQQSQTKRLEERKAASPLHKQVCGINFVIDRGVYGTSVDTELMAETVMVNAEDSFLEIGCGSGAVSLLVAKRCAGGMATDINPLAIINAQTNAKLLKENKVEFVLGNGFAGIEKKFNVLICNPPYNNLPAKDPIDRMFWDPDDEVKKEFFKKAAKYLLPDGRIYFGWANFQDIDVDLPIKLAEENKLKLVNIAQRSAHSGNYIFYVLEFSAD